MIAVIFEFRPKDENKQAYLDVAAELKPIVEAHDGFVSIERFQSITDPGKMLSLSVFRDEESLNAWRQVAEHRIAQAKGRSALFEDYRLRVTGVIRDYSMTDRAEAPDDSRAIHDKSEVAAANA